MQDTNTWTGRTIVHAESSLTSFAIQFDDGTGVLLEATGGPGKPTITAHTMPAEELPKLNEAVCSVDWQWIHDSAVQAVSGGEANVRIHLEPAGPLTVSVALWQGKPFLAFQPFRAPSRV